MKEEIEFTPYCAFDTEGGRVGICTCRECGAAILIESEESTKDWVDSIKLHVEWHYKLSGPTL